MGGGPALDLILDNGQPGVTTVGFDHPASAVPAMKARTI